MAIASFTRIRRQLLCFGANTMSMQINDRALTACYCDYDPPQFYHATRPIARKPHKCSECGGTIQPGERYERVHGKWDGAPETYKTCVYCLAMRDLVESRLPCFCWQHHSMNEDLVETVRNSDDMPGLQMAVGRIMVERKAARLLQAKVV